MGPKAVVLTFAAVVAAVLVGFVGGGLVHEVVGTQPEVAIGVVDAPAGTQVATPTPPPVPTTAAPAGSVTPTGSVEPSPGSPSPDASLEPCPGTPPRDGCECRERRRNSRWVCPLT